mmetsp:Transcript_34749/g.88917  ORF Transcript_34749/g.88917 Transcript_34749/m.88917 type:complete len:187 (+) Transcript_34749:122-682(+)
MKAATAAGSGTEARGWGREERLFQLMDESRLLRAQLGEERHRLDSAREGAAQAAHSKLLHKSMVPLLAHHVTSWQRESRRAAKQLQFAEVVKHLYPAVAVPQSVWDYEKAATTRHYTNGMIRVRRELDSVQREYAQNGSEWVAASEQHRQAEEECQQAAMSVAELEEKQERAREQLFDAVFGHTWR